MRDENGLSRGFGFVCFREWKDAQKALDDYGPNGSGYSADSSEEYLDSDGNPRPAMYVCEAKTKE